MISKINRFIGGGALFLVAWLMLFGGCTYIPFDYTGAGCVELTAVPIPGQFGFQFSDETLGFEGTVIKGDPNSETWKVDGVFNFPTRGYTVGEPDIEVLGTWPQEVFISIPFWSPKVISWVCNADTEIPVSAKISAATNAQFTITICNRPEPRCGSEEP
jgi:hypothetical protein